MGNFIGCYYLHINGSLIYKPGTESSADIRESDFARALWLVDPTDRGNCWSILVEALSLGANSDRVNELAAKWECDNEDAAEFSAHIGVRLYRDGDAWCATYNGAGNLQESPHGFGETALDALADLCGSLGYKASKMWGGSFRQLITSAVKAATDKGLGRE